MKTSQQEQEVIRAAQKGNYAGFNKLLMHNTNRQLSVAFGILKDQAEAEEAVQDAMLQAFRNISKFRFQSSFSTWLHRITVNTSLTRRRKIERERTRQQSLEPGEDRIASWAEASPQQSLEKVQRRDLLGKALQSLPDRHRLAVTLFHHNELTYVEIAEMMEMPLNTVKTYIRRGREQLANILVRSGRMPLMMDCANATNSMHDYYENVLAPQQRVAIALHLENCSHCTQAYNTMEQLFKDLPQATGINPSAGYLKKLTLELEQETYRASLKRVLLRTLIFALCVACFLLLPIIGMAIFGQPVSTMPEFFTSLDGSNSPVNFSIGVKGGVVLTITLLVQLGLAALFAMPLLRQSK